MKTLQLTWHEPLIAWATFAVLLLVLALYFWGHYRRKRILEGMLQPSLIPVFTAQINPFFRLLKATLLTLAAVVLTLAIARPQWGYFWEEQPQKSVDVILALDTSRSMLTPDINPNRLTRAKLAIEDLLGNLQGARVGLIPFAGDALVWCPLTYDKSAFLSTLRSVDTNIIPVRGTNIAAALETARRAFSSEKDTSRILVILSDGEDLESQLPHILPTITKDGWVVHTIGIGTAEGELIPITRDDGSSFFVTDTSGNVVKSRLDENTLRMISGRTGGSYYPLGTLGEGLHALFANHILHQIKERENNRLRKVNIERYHWFVLLVLGLLFTELFVSDRKRTTAQASAILRDNRASLLAVSLILLGLVFTPSQAQASIERRAQDAFEQGDFAKAALLFQQAGEESRHEARNALNQGISALRADDIETAKAALGKTITSGVVPVQKPAYYNLGNAMMLSGYAMLDQNPQAALGEWQNAVAHYEGALALDPSNENARHNLDLANRLVEELRKHLEQQQEQQQQSQDGDSDNQEKSDSDQEGSSSSKGQKSEPTDDASASETQEPSESQDEGQYPEAQDAEEEQQAGEDKPDNAKQEPQSKPQQSEPAEKPQPAQPQLADDASELQPPPPQEASPSTDETPLHEDLQEALLLLESLRGEEGDYADFHFRTITPDEDASSRKDW